MKKEYIKPEIMVCHLGEQLMLTSSKENEIQYYEEDLPEDENEYMY